MMFDWTTTLTLALACAVVLYIRGKRSSAGRLSHPLPPGPPGLPWIGNIIGINTSVPWMTFSEWAQTYGDLIYTRFFGKNVIIINSESIAKDLFEVRSRNYFDRPNLVICGLCGMDFSTVLMGYNDRWRQQRRLFHQTFRVEAAARFVSYQHNRASHFLHQLLLTPEKLDDHIFEYTTSVILNSVYGYVPASRNDEFVDVVASVLDIVLPLIRPDLSIIFETFPLLLRLPSWLPGMSFKKKMEKAREYTKYYLNRPFQYSLAKESTGFVAHSMMHDGLQAIEKRGHLEDASGTAFLAASETSNSVLLSFFLWVMLNLGVQERAQAQIDAIVGKTRLPTIEDRPLLPYIDAIFWETLRHSPVAPLSVPHTTVEDDVYNGFHIPKGSILLANLWSMGHNESRYPNPHVFHPERFLNEDGSLKPINVEHIAFGFGRRICVGRHFAEMSVWAVIAKVLAVFKVLGPLNEDETEVPIEPKYSIGLAVHPVPFKYRIIPRFSEMDVENLEELIAASTCTSDNSLKRSGELD